MKTRRPREANKLLREHLLAALTLRWNAPFKEIRQRMTKLLKEAAVSEGMRLARSALVSCGFVGQCARVSRPTVSWAMRTSVPYNVVLMASASGKGENEDEEVEEEEEAVVGESCKARIVFQ